MNSGEIAPVVDASPHVVLLNRQTYLMPHMALIAVSATARPEWYPVFRFVYQAYPLYVNITYHPIASLYHFGLTHGGAGDAIATIGKV
jgi:hypothetical protein